MILVKDVKKSYGALEVLKGLNLEVKSGETVVILGRSGVGKSVLLRQIIGIEHPDSGEILIDGQNLQTLSPLEKQKIIMRMGMLFQGSALFDSMNVFENTAFFLRQHNKNIKEDEVKERVHTSLKTVGLEDVSQKMPSELSGGMRKRAAMARLIIYRPNIVLFDEPTTGLDPITAMQINEMINRIKEDLKTTAIVVTHDIKSALVVGDRIALHENGVIHTIAPKDEFFRVDDPDIRSFYENAKLGINKG